MNLIRKHLHRELGVLLRSVVNPQHAYLISAWGDLSQSDLQTQHQLDQTTLTRGAELSERLQTDLPQDTRAVVLLGALNSVDDVYSALEGTAESLGSETRLVNVSYNRLWRPLIRLLRGRFARAENWIPPSEITNLLEQSGFEVVELRTAVVMPLPIPLLSRWCNRWLSPLPVFRLFSVYNVTIARAVRTAVDSNPQVSVIVAARNEEGNIDALIRRLPRMSRQQELIFVEGGSSDDTWGAIQRAVTQSKDSELRISAYQQSGRGKGDAVRLGFQHAQGDILIILDADLSVPPEELPRFIALMRTGHCEFANGSRLVYPMEQQAMQFLNLLGNRFFGIVFTFLLGQPIRDTLCGTKALWARDYQRIAAGRSHFGDFDPFGDFDLLFGAARLHLKIRDIPVHYKERVYGATNISRFRHGALLLKMTIVAAHRLRFV